MRQFTLFLPLLILTVTYTFHDRDKDVVTHPETAVVDHDATRCGKKGCDHNDNESGDSVHFINLPAPAIPLRHLEAGETFRVNLPGREISATVERVWGRDGDDRSLRARLNQPDEGNLWLKWRGSKITGMVQRPARNIAYQLSGHDYGPLQVRETMLSHVLCVMPASGGPAGPNQPVSYGIPRPTNEIFTTRSKGTIRTAAVPVLQSRPESSRVIYLDFDGEIVNDAAWSSSTINAAPARLNDSQIIEAWQRVVADFDHADVNITTVLADFDNAPFSSRTHVIITATDDAAPGAGGVAFMDSFTDGYSRYCWVFVDYEAKSCAEVISHEVGHTLNLSHDGRNISPPEEYYEGHGDGNTGWAPIMGVGYYRDFVQWSRGEYPDANNAENDLAIIAEKLPYLDDDHGNTIALATAINGSSAVGRIGRTNDVDLFRIQLHAGSHTINVQPLDHGNLDGQIEILNASGGTITSTNPVDELFASATFTLATSQTIYLRVSGTGKAANGSDFGYTAYSSLGTYTLNGFGNQTQPPSAPADISLRAISGSQLEATWQHVASATSYDVRRNSAPFITTTNNTFTDRGLTPGASYVYQIQSSNLYGTSGLSLPAAITMPAADAFVMDGNPDFSGYLISNPGMVIYAAVRGQRLYVSTWSPGDGDSGFGSDHHLLISDVLLASATTPNPWAKAGLMAIPGNKPYLAGESTSTYASWFNTKGATTLFKGRINNLQLEGSIDLAAEFGTVPATIYLAAIAFATFDGNGINGQAPAGNGNNNIEPSEFIAVPVAAIRDRALDGIYDILSPERDFAFTSATIDNLGRLQFNSLAIPGITYALHRSTNLAIPRSAWPGIASSSVPAGNFSVIITDPQPANEARFYQLQWSR